MKIFVKTVILLIIIIIAQISFGFRERDFDYEIQMDHLEVINSPNGNSFDFKTWRITKLNRTCYVMLGDVLQTTEDLTKVDVELIVNFMQGNVYKYSPFGVKRKPFCDFWKNDYKTLLYASEHAKYSNFPEPEECPFPKVYCLYYYLHDLMGFFLIFFRDNFG